MPMPAPHDDESNDDFIARCMGDEVMVSDFPDEAQRRAVCQRQLEDKSAKLVGAFDTKVTSIKGERAVRAQISTVSVDDDGDVLVPGGIDLKRFRKNPQVLFVHDTGRLPLGIAPQVERQKDGVLAKVEFAKRPESHPSGLEWFPDTVLDLFRQKVLRAFSVGFRIITARRADERDMAKFGDAVRQVVTKWRLMEFSVVLVPANEDALAVAVKNGLDVSPCLKKLWKIGVDNPEVTRIVLPGRLVMPPRLRVG